MSPDEKHLVQLFLPLAYNDGGAVPREEFDRVFKELTERFGGVTAYQRSPAEGAWKPAERDVSYDRVVAYEVMTERLDTDWWSTYRRELEGRYRQEKILLRTFPVWVL